MTERRKAIKVGLILSPLEDRGGSLTPGWKELQERAIVADQAGFSSLWISDHLIHRFPGVPDYGIWECWSLVSAIAAVTERIQIGTWVLGAGFRNPALLAKMADTVDEISDGRLILGIGSGWHEPEYTAFGYPFDNRVARFEEAITIIHGLLRNGEVDFEGRFYQARECELRPRGPRPAGPPIMIGTIGGTPLASRLKVEGSSPKMLQLVAKYADIWNCPWINDPALAPGINAMVDTACDSVGRDPGSLERSHGLMIDLPGFDQEVGSELFRSGRHTMGSRTGSTEELATLIRQFGEAGIDEVHVQIDPENPSRIEEFARVLELI